jgi:hypothetical protein
MPVSRSAGFPEYTAVGVSRTYRTSRCVDGRHLPNATELEARDLSWAAANVDDRPLPRDLLREGAQEGAIERLVAQLVAKARGVRFGDRVVPRPGSRDVQDVRR